MDSQTNKNLNDVASDLEENFKQDIDNETVKDSLESEKNQDKDVHVKLQEAEKKIEELTSSWLRALADYKNLKERTEREKGEFLKFAGEEVIRKLLPVYDSFEMLTKFNTDRGLHVTAKQFQQVLGDLGLEVLKVDGEEFDPALMEAVEMVPGEKNKVVEVLQKGFNFRGKLLRVALVKVGNGN